MRTNSLNSFQCRYLLTDWLLTVRISSPVHLHSFFCLHYKPSLKQDNPCQLKHLKIDELPYTEPYFMQNHHLLFIKMENSLIYHHLTAATSQCIHRLSKQHRSHKSETRNIPTRHWDWIMTLSHTCKQTYNSSISTTTCGRSTQNYRLLDTMTNSLKKCKTTSNLQMELLPKNPDIQQLYRVKVHNRLLRVIRSPLSENHLHDLTVSRNTSRSEQVQKRTG